MGRRCWQVLQQTTHPSSSAIRLGADHATAPLHSCLWVPAFADSLPIEMQGQHLLKTLPTHLPACSGKQGCLVVRCHDLRACSDAQFMQRSPTHPLTLEERMWFAAYAPCALSCQSLDAGHRHHLTACLPTCLVVWQRRTLAPRCSPTLTTRLSFSSPSRSS